MTTRNKYDYRCVLVERGVMVGSPSSCSPNRMKQYALAISLEHQGDIQVQRREPGAKEWEDTRSRFRRGQQITMGGCKV